MRLEPKERSKEEIAIVDLSSPQPRARAIRTGRLHAKVMSYLQSHGEASRADLMARFPRMPYSDLLGAVEDLSLLGKVEVRWTSPFDFTVHVHEEDRASKPTRLVVMA
ncbi:MAG: hypothetical protein ACE5HJ_05910 [Thermoplasmata archaeon]